MKIWHIAFGGLWPVGAAAIVVTLDSGDSAIACALFREEWRAQYPMHDPEPVTASLLDCGPGRVHILLDGEQR